MVTREVLWGLMIPFAGTSVIMADKAMMEKSKAAGGLFQRASGRCKDAGALPEYLPELPPERGLSPK